MDPEMFANYSPGARRYATIWDDVINAAEEFNDPSEFTAFIGFEWTSLEKGANLHRNVIFRDGPDRARQVVPYTTQAPVGSNDPLDLYKYLENYEAKTNGATMTFAHNGNLSNGIMFPMDAQFTGKAIDKFYVEQRAKWERMYEVTQIKGDGEAHPFLSPEDEFADYGNWDYGNLDLTEAKTDEMLPTIRDWASDLEPENRGAILKMKSPSTGIIFDILLFGKYIVERFQNTLSCFTLCVDSLNVLRPIIPNRIDPLGDRYPWTRRTIAFSGAW